MRLPGGWMSSLRARFWTTWPRCSWGLEEEVGKGKMEWSFPDGIQFIDWRIVIWILKEDEFLEYSSSEQTCVWWLADNKICASVLENQVSKWSLLPVHDWAREREIWPIVSTACVQLVVEWESESCDQGVRLDRNGRTILLFRRDGLFWDLISRLAHRS